MKNAKKINKNQNASIYDFGDATAVVNHCHREFPSREFQTSLNEYCSNAENEGDSPRTSMNKQSKTNQDSQEILLQVYFEEKSSPDFVRNAKNQIEEFKDFADNPYGDNYCQFETIKDKIQRFSERNLECNNGNFS